MRLAKEFRLVRGDAVDELRALAPGGAFPEQELVILRERREPMVAKPLAQA